MNTNSHYPMSNHDSISNNLQTPTHELQTPTKSASLPQGYTPVRGNVPPAQFLATPQTRPSYINEGESASVSTLGSMTTHDIAQQRNLHFLQIIAKHIVKNDFTTVCPHKLNMDIISTACEGDDEEVYGMGLDTKHLERLCEELQDVGAWRTTADKRWTKLEKSAKFLGDFYDNGGGEEIFRGWLNDTEKTQRELEEKLLLIVATKENAKKKWQIISQAAGKQHSDVLQNNVKVVKDWLKGKNKDTQVN